MGEGEGLQEASVIITQHNSSEKQHFRAFNVNPPGHISPSTLHSESSRILAGWKHLSEPREAGQEIEGQETMH
jgi:hypothetical protein